MNAPPPPGRVGRTFRLARAGGTAGPAARDRTLSGPVDPGPPPDARRLHEAALAHLARFSATEIGLCRVLRRRINRWSQRALAAGRDPAEVSAQSLAAVETVLAVAKRLADAKVVDDAAFAESRTRSLSRGGRSRRAIGAHLAGRGVAQELIETAIEQSAGSDLHAAVLQARRRRIGPFGQPGALEDPAAWARALGALARAGFDRDTAERALRMHPDEAERIVLARHAL